MTTPTRTTDNPKPAGNAKIVAICLGLVFGMAGLSYASVPLYELFCRVTGYGGTPQVAASDSDVPVSDRTIRVRFDANTASGLRWNFAPEQREIEVRLGEKTVVNYVAENLSDQPLSGMATFNVTPQAVGAYFNKIECFCFTDTQIEAGGKLKMPVVFFVDPELYREEEFRAVRTITLSYTFYESDEEPQEFSSTKSGTDAGVPADQKL